MIAIVLVSVVICLGMYLFHRTYWRKQPSVFMGNMMVSMLLYLATLKYVDYSGLSPDILKESLVDDLIIFIGIFISIYVTYAIWAYHFVHKLTDMVNRYHRYSEYDIEYKSSKFFNLLDGDIFHHDNVRYRKIGEERVKVLESGHILLNDGIEIWFNKNLDVYKEKC